MTTKRHSHSHTYAFQFQHIWHIYLIIRNRIECTIIHALIPPTGSIPAVISRTTHVLTRSNAAHRIRILRTLKAEPRTIEDFDHLFNPQPTDY